MKLASGNQRYWLHTTIYFVLTFGIGLIPYSGLPELGMRVLGVFVGLIYGWSFLGFIWPSCVSILALGFSGYDTPLAILAGAFSNEIVIFLILTMVFIAYCEDSGLSNKIACWFLSRKLIQGRPYVFAFIVMLATFALGIAISGVQAMLLIWGMLYGIFEELKYKKMDDYPAYLCYGIVFAAVASFSARAWTGVPLLTMASLNGISGGDYAVPFLSFTLIACLTFIIAFVLYLTLIKIILKPDVSNFLANKDLGYVSKMSENSQLNRQEKVAAGAFCIFLLLLFVPSFIPAGSALAPYAKKLSMSIAALSVIAVLCIIRIDGKPALKFQECATKGISWNVVLMVVAMLPLTSALSAESVGLTAWLGGILAGCFADMGTITFLTVIIIACVLITQIAHNAIAASLIVSMTYPMCMSLGLNPVVMAILVAYAAGLALLTPAASTGAAIGFSNAEWIGTRNALKCGSVATIVGSVCLLLIALPLCLLFIN